VLYNQFLTLIVATLSCLALRSNCVNVWHPNIICWMFSHNDDDDDDDNDNYYFLNYFATLSAASITAGITSAFIFHTRCSHLKPLYCKYFGFYLDHISFS
jgi:hypothetical protein